MLAGFYCYREGLGAQLDDVNVAGVTMGTSNENCLLQRAGITRLLKQMRQLSRKLSADLVGSDVLRRAKLWRKLVSHTRSTIACTSLETHAELVEITDFGGVLAQHHRRLLLVP